MSEKAINEQAQNLSDESLVAAIRGGDRQAFTVLVRRYGLKFRATAHRFLADQAQAEEIVQEAFIKLWTHPERFDPARAKFTTWFYRVVTNACLDERRRLKAKSAPMPLPDKDIITDPAPLAVDWLGQKQSLDVLYRALSTLPERQQEALRLTYLEGFSNRQAADMMTLTIKAFESLVLRARAKLREALSDEQVDLLTTLG